MNGSIGASLFYGVSCLIIYIAILLYPRKQKKEALITGLALSAVILESYIAFLHHVGTTKLVKAEHSMNAQLAIAFTLSGIVKLVRPSYRPKLPTYLTGLPPSVDGIDTAPVGSGEMPT